MKVIALLLALLVASAGVQAADLPTPAQAACLVKPTEPLKYPEASDERRNGGTLRFKLRFDRPDRAPRVELLRFAGTRELAEAAEDYLRRYRLPCLGAGETAEFEQELAFVDPHDTRAVTAKASSGLACLRTPGPQDVRQDMQIGSRIKQRQRGNVLLELRFVAPDQPPEVKTLYASADASFIAHVQDLVAEYRLPCMTAGDPPRAMQQFFRFNGYARDSDLVLKDMGLVSFLRAAKDVDKVPVKFDLDGMACPFQLRMSLYQPGYRNNVDEVGAPVPQRKPLMDWLAGLGLSLSKDQFEAVMGQKFTLDVPCGKIEL